MASCSHLHLPALLNAQGGDGDQAGGQDEGGSEEGGAHQLEEDREDHHQISEVPSSYLRLEMYDLILRKRDISGDDLRREFWVHEEANSPKKKKKEGRGYDVKLDQPKVDDCS